MVEDVHVKLRGLGRTCWSGVVSISITTNAGPSSFQVTTTTEDTTASFSRGSGIVGVTVPTTRWTGRVFCLVHRGRPCCAFLHGRCFPSASSVFSFRVVGAFLTRTHTRSTLIGFFGDCFFFTGPLYPSLKHARPSRQKDDDPDM